MNIAKIIFMIFLLLVFLAGGYFYVFQNVPFKENMEQAVPGTENKDAANTTQGAECPDFLIQYGTKLLLYNTKQPQSIGKNPIEFTNIDEYNKYLEEQKRNGMNCPVLFLQQETNTQGMDILRMRPSPENPMAGLSQTTALYRNPPFVLPVIDSTDDNKPYNENLHYGFDPYGLQVGKYTVLDQIHDSTQVPAVSDNPMDPNWGGVLYTKQTVDSGKYKEREVVPPAQSGIFALKTDNIHDTKQSLDIFA